MAHFRFNRDSPSQLRRLVFEPFVHLCSINASFLNIFFIALLIRSTPNNNIYLPNLIASIQCFPAPSRRIFALHLSGLQRTNADNKTFLINSLWYFSSLYIVPARYQKKKFSDNANGFDVRPSASPGEHTHPQSGPSKVTSAEMRNASLDQWRTNA